MSRLRGALRLGAFAGMTLPLMPLQQLFLWTAPSLARGFPHRYHRWVCRVLGISVAVTGAPVRSGACLYVVNHVSWMDIVVLSAALPVSFIAKREVARWPFFGTLARLQRTVFVDRDRRHSSGASRDEIAERLAAGDQLALFAEGTSNDGRSVQPFRSAFFGAAETGNGAVRVQPVTLVYSRLWGLPLTRRYRPSVAWYGDMELPGHLFQAVASGPVAVEVAFHEPFTLAEKGGRKLAAREAERVVREHLMARIAGRPASGDSPEADVV